MARMKTFLWAVLLTLISAPIGFSQSSTPVTAGQVNVTNGSGGYTLQPYSGGSSGSSAVVYASTLTGAHTGQAISPGSSATSAVDSAAALNTALAAGNIKLILDSGYALSTSLVMYSGDTIDCVNKTNGLIMMVGANAVPIINAHQNAPTTASGTGGFLPSNITDKNLAVQNCTINANATQAVTGSNAEGTAHSVNPATGLFVFGMEFSGVDHVLVDNNEVYDTGCWSVFLANTLYSRVTNNYIHQPTPIVQNKATDGVHLIGPDQFSWIQSNRITSGDDAVALNADDGNRTGSGDPNASYVPTFVKWGPITDVVEDNNTLDGATFGGRLLSATELIDRVSITNLKGTTLDYIFNISAEYPSIGSGNMGSVTFDNIDLHTLSNVYSRCGEMLLYTNIHLLQIRNLRISNPFSTQPVVCQSAGTVGILSLHDFDIYTQSSSVTSVVATTGGSIAQILASGLNWYDSGSGSFFAGSVVPSTLTVSNYAGPNRLIPASGYVPVTENGDAFTNTYATVPAAIHFWPMNEGSGSTFVDNIGTTNLTSSNVTYSVTSGMGSTAVAQFNGSSSSAHAAGVDSTLNFNGTQPMTVCYWSAGATLASATAIGNLQTTSSFQGWEAGYGGSGPEANFLVVGAVTTNQLTLTNTAASTSGLYCWTYSGSLAPSGLLLYVNGALHSTTTTTATLTSGSTSTSAVYVGSRSNSTNFYSGSMGYMRVWNQVLTSAQIATLFGLGPR